MVYSSWSCARCKQYTWRPSHWWYFDRIWNSMKFCNALVHNIFGRSQRNFAHVVTVTLSWHVQNLVVIGWSYFEWEHSKIWSNFKFDRNLVSGMGAELRMMRLWWYYVHFSGNSYDFTFYSLAPGRCTCNYKSADPDLRHHMALLGHNKLTHWL